MTETTVRFVLPLMVPGQGAKDVTHNEAILAIDALMHPVAQSRTLASPPAAPLVGDAWIVATDANENWSGRDGQLALWTDQGWRFVAMPEGATCWCADEGVRLRREGEHWRTEPDFGPAPPAIPAPAGGVTIDQEVRATVSLILQRMREVGLAS